MILSKNHSGVQSFKADGLQITLYENDYKIKVISNEPNK